MKQPLLPHITEKAYAGISEDGSVSSTYVFRVAPDLDKDTIRKLVEKQHGVTVVDVNVVRLPGKARRFRGRLGRTSEIKKAYVRLRKGDRITAFSTEESKKTDNQ